MAQEEINNPARNASHSDAGGELEQLKKDLEEAKVKSEEYLNGWKRERADFLNYKKEEMERMGALIKYANEELILKILPILDNIERAERELPENLKTGKAGQKSAIEWTKGFLQIKTQLNEFLQKEGIEPIKSLGKAFDPNTMEVVGEIENPDHKVSNMVLEEVERGYTMHRKLIRPARVKISK